MLLAANVGAVITSLSCLQVSLFCYLLFHLFFLVLPFFMFFLLLFADVTFLLFSLSSVFLAYFYLSSLFFLSFVYRYHFSIIYSSICFLVLLPFFSTFTLFCFYCYLSWAVTMFCLPYSCYSCIRPYLDLLHLSFLTVLTHWNLEILTKEKFRFILHVTMKYPVIRVCSYVVRKGLR